MADARIFHHDLCFGCGQANLFGLQLELEPRPAGGVEGRFFVKQDHQGPPGVAHGGVIAAALDEAMALLLQGQGTAALTVRLEVDLLAPAPVGAFVTVRAELLESRDRKLVLNADAAVEGEAVARAKGVFLRPAASSSAPPLDV
ncbi:MAG TPA: PaaI family thioesterase [Thermoleophilaceae bacterium]|nr:PaaI family thioesterase [Thermoleophilaceae bacterium]